MSQRTTPPEERTGSVLEAGLRRSRELRLPRVSGTAGAAGIEHRTETRIARATRKAGFPFLKTLGEFDFTFQKSLQRKALGPYLGPELVSGGGV